MCQAEFFSRLRKIASHPLNCENKEAEAYRILQTDLQKNHVWNRGESSPHQSINRCGITDQLFLHTTGLGSFIFFIWERLEKSDIGFAWSYTQMSCGICELYIVLSELDGEHSTSLPNRYPPVELPSSPLTLVFSHMNLL